jgi:hypothetical protein
MMAIARRMTINGVPNFCHAGLRREGTCSTTLGAIVGAGDGAVAGTGEVAICVQVLLDAIVLFTIDFADRSRERITLPYMNLSTFTATYAQSQLSEIAGVEFVVIG